MNRDEFEKIERREVTKEDLEAALKGVLLSETDRPKSENREPTTEELRTRWRLHRRDTDAEPNAAE
ncbi:MAG: hypothetical protein OXQ29_19070 [Rhodospirillaceae bacterium]|nr:hypothetical protein [Rhodospirillaceae bacterium]